MTAVSCMHGSCSFVTEFVPGEKVENDDEAKLFLEQVAGTFAEAGLSVWQVNPRNPHAHTNLIRTPHGDFKIIDLESAVVTLLPARGQWLSSLRAGKLPVFDDIDFPRFRNYIATNKKALETSLGRKGLAEPKNTVDRAEQAIQLWKDAEPRIWGRLIGRIYRLLDVKGFTQHLMGTLDGADTATEAFLDAASLGKSLSSGEARNARHHLGAHLVLSVVIAVPIPGLRSLARFLWTLTFSFRSQISRLRRKSTTLAQRCPTFTPPWS